MNPETKYIMVVEEDNDTYFIGRNRHVVGKFTLFKDSSDALKAPSFEIAQAVANCYESDSEGAHVKIYPVHVTYEVDET